jgi:hypothetical protein
MKKGRQALIPEGRLFDNGGKVRRRPEVVEWETSRADGLPDAARRSAEPDHAL